MEYESGKLSVHIELVKLGVRSAARMTLRREMLAEATLAIVGAGLAMCVKDAGEHHVDLFIFKHAHLGRVIDQALASPKPLRDWALGRLFGYSEDAIGDFVRKESAP